MKTQIKQQRLDILNRITALENKRCPPCSVATTESDSLNCQCDAAVEIRELGTQIDGLVRERKTIGAKEEQMYNDPDMIELAVKNGIGYEYFWQRVNKYGWSERRAATEPVKRKAKKR